MERRNRSAAEGQYAGSFMFGTASPNPRKVATPLVSRTSHSPIVRSPSPTHIRAEIEPKSTITKSRTKKPPLSSVLDDNLVTSSSTPINEFQRVGHQFQAPDSQQQQHQPNHLFTGSPPPRKYGYDISMSLEDPFERRDDSQWLSASAAQNQFGSPQFQPSMARRLGSSSSALQGQMNVAVESKGALTLGQFGHTTERQDVGWSCWVIVYGYQINDVNNNDAILLRFQEYGAIDRYSPSNGNWIFIRYESPAFADRAVSQNGTFFNANTVIAVSRLDPSIAKYMNLQLSRDGTLTAGDVDVSVIYTAKELDAVSERSSLMNRKTGKRVTVGKYEVEESAAGERSASRDSLADEQHLYLRPYKTKSVCTKIMEFFFSY